MYKGLSREMEFNQLIDSWCDNYRFGVKESTFFKTKIIIDKKIRPEFGKLSLQSINSEYCQSVIDYWASEYSSTRYCLFINYLKRIFEFAIIKGLLKQNPMNFIIIPKKKEEKAIKKIKYYSKEELSIFFQTILSKKQNTYIKTRDYTLFRLLAFTGCRIGECLALDWQDINFTSFELSINKTLTKGQNYYISPTPKTEKSQRVILLDAETLHQLDKWKIQQKIYLESKGYSKANYLFTNKNNQFTINQTIAERYKIYQQEAKLKNIGLHGFRHTHASLLFESGADYKDVQERLGHQNIQTTMDIYTHLSKKRQNETIQRFSLYMNN